MYQYDISREDYLNLMKAMLRKERNERKNLLFCVIAGAIFPIASLYHLLTVDKLQSWHILLVGFMVLCVYFSANHYFFIDKRAKALLEQAEKSGQLPPDYWGTHNLEFRGNGIHVEYGEMEMDLSGSDIATFDSLGGFRVLGKGERIFEIMPEEGMSSAEWDEFGLELEKKRNADQIDALEAHYRNTVKDARFIGKFKLSHKEMAKRYAVMQRRAQALPGNWTPRFLFGFLAPGLPMFYFLAAGKWNYALICLAFMVLFKCDLLLILLPSYEKKAAKSVPAAGPEGYRLVVTSKAIYLYGLYQVQEQRLINLMHQTENNGDIRLYFAGQGVLFVPSGLAAAFKTKIGALKIRKMFGGTK